jgi:hypothetical protein
MLPCVRFRIELSREEPAMKVKNNAVEKTRPAKGERGRRTASRGSARPAVLVESRGPTAGADSGLTLVLAACVEEYELFCTDWFMPPEHDVSAACRPAGR